jgi:hypothetical protein
MAVNRLKEILPKYTDDFSTILEVSSLVRNGSIITCTTATAHGLSTGDYVTVRKAKEPIALSAITFLNGIATATATSDHLLIDPSQYSQSVLPLYVEITGAIGFNGVWELVSVPSKLVFTFKVSGNPSNISNGFLLLEDFDGYNGYKQITKINSNSFSYITTGLMQSPAQGSIQVSCLTRVEESATATRIQEFYSQSNKIYQSWMFVVFNKSQAFKNESVVGDSTSALKAHQSYWSEEQQEFSVYVVLPAADSILAGDIASKARGYRAILLKCLANHAFESDLNEQITQPCQFIGHEADDYIKATYTHRFDFTYQSIIQTADTTDFNTGRPIQLIEGTINQNLEFIINAR